MRSVTPQERPLPDRLVLTGPTGWVGTAVLAEWARLKGAGWGDSVAAFGSFAREHRAPDGTVLQVRALEDLCGDDVDGAAVVHLAYLTRSKAEAVGPAAFVAANTAIDDVVLNALRTRRPSSVFVASSGAAGEAFAGRDEHPYAQCKLDQEGRFRAWATVAGVPLLVGRIFALAGAGMTEVDSYALGSFVSQARRDGLVAIRSSSPTYRSYLHVDDLAALVCSAAARREGRPGPVDLCGAEVVELGDLASTVIEHVGGEVTVVRERIELDDAGSVHRYVGDFVDTHVLAQQLGVRLRSLREQVADTDADLRTRVLAARGLAVQSRPQAPRLPEQRTAAVPERSSTFEDLFVLELANNHWGDIDRGHKIVEDFARVVQENGVRAAIKLQFRDVDSFVHPEHRHREDVRYIRKTLATKLPWSDLRALVDAVRDAGMTTMVTPFDEASVARCEEFGVEVIKIASSDIRDKSLLRAVASVGRPVAASTGGAELEHVDALVDFFTSRGVDFALNHCVSIYPSRDDELELNQIDFLRDRYPGVTIGFSTHEQRDWRDSLLVAYAKGARTFERHIDIDHQGVPVSPYCTRPHEADTWFKAFHKVKELVGGPADRKRDIPENERRYLDALVRGVYCRRSLPAGHVLTDDDVFTAVPLLRGQLSTREFETGEVLLAPVAAGGPVDLRNVRAYYSDEAALVDLVDDRGLVLTDVLTEQA